MKQIKLEINVSIIDVFSHEAVGMKEDGWWKMRFDESDEISPSKETHNDGLEVLKILKTCALPSTHLNTALYHQDVKLNLTHSVLLW